jgi:hypothetical protein
MGDRGNIGIRQPDEQTTVYLYTHWAGSLVPALLAEGLKRTKEAGRLTDPAYATRIIFDTLTGLDGGSTGYGISIGAPCDNEHEIPYLVWENWSEPTIHYGCGKFSVDSWIEGFARAEATTMPSLWPRWVHSC